MCARSVLSFFFFFCFVLLPLVLSYSVVFNGQIAAVLEERNQLLHLLAKEREKTTLLERQVQDLDQKANKAEKLKRVLDKVKFASCMRMKWFIHLCLSPRPPREARCEDTNLDVHGVLLHAW